jgi:hypothetical protein
VPGSMDTSAGTKLSPGGEAWWVLREALPVPSVDCKLSNDTTTGEDQVTSATLIREGHCDMKQCSSRLGGVTKTTLLGEEYAALSVHSDSRLAWADCIPIATFSLFECIKATMLLACDCKRGAGSLPQPSADHRDGRFGWVCRLTRGRGALVSGLNLLPQYSEWDASGSKRVPVSTPHRTRDPVEPAQIRA